MGGQGVPSCQSRNGTQQAGSVTTWSVVVTVLAGADGRTAERTANAVDQSRDGDPWLSRGGSHRCEDGDLR